jgi:hypothetical protein
VLTLLQIEAYRNELPYCSVSPHPVPLWWTTLIEVAPCNSEHDVKLLSNGFNYNDMSVQQIKKPFDSKTAQSNLPTILEHLKIIYYIQKLS